MFEIKSKSNNSKRIIEKIDIITIVGNRKERSDEIEPIGEFQETI